MKQLTLKTIALIALSSSDRSQTLHLASLGNMSISEEKVEFIIRERTKTTRKILKPSIITCVSCEKQPLNVAFYVKMYIEKTKEFRQENNRLFISWCTKKPVTKQTLARWLVEVLRLAGIDTSTYKSHSYRGAGLSHAFQKGASINQIMKAGNWANESTFRKFYNCPSNESEIGKIILDC